MNLTRRRAVERQTANKLFSKGQSMLLLLIVVLFAYGVVLWTHVVLVIVVAMILLFYVLFVGQKIVLHWASLGYVPPSVANVSIDDPDLPTYTLFVPLYHEANMLKGLVGAINGLHYPKDKLQVLLLLEEDDLETQAEAVGMELDEWFDIITIPHLKPKGKPKALNMGLAEIGRAHV